MHTFGFREIKKSKKDCPLKVIAQEWMVEQGITLEDIDVAALDKPISAEIKKG